MLGKLVVEGLFATANVLNRVAAELTFLGFELEQLVNDKLPEPESFDPDDDEVADDAYIQALRRRNENQFIPSLGPLPWGQEAWDYLNQIGELDV